MIRVQFLPICRNERSLMIVAMQNVDGRQRHTNKFERRPLESNPAVCLIRVVQTGGGIDIDAFAVKKAVDANQEYANGGIGHDSGLNIKIQSCRNWIGMKPVTLKINTPVARNDNADCSSQLFQLRRKSTQDVRQTSNFRVRGGFPGDHDDAHQPFTSSRARTVAFTTALMRVVRRPPSSSSRMPSMVHPAGVVTTS